MLWTRHLRHFPGRLNSARIVAANSLKTPDSVPTADPRSTDPIMEGKIEIRCKEKEQELLDKYFPNGAGYSKSETIGEYTKDLPLKIESEFREYLAELWNEYSETPLVLEENKLRWLMTEDDREAVDAAYDDAKRITLWERITKTNHEDVTYYKGLLFKYTKDLLMIMHHDFLEEITGRHINCKAFDE